MRVSKFCKRCSASKAIEEFHTKGVLCKECHRADCRERHQRERFKKYKTTREAVDKLFLKQRKMCAICLCTDPGKAGWRIDHNHKFDFVRGVLCHHCNILLGHAKENELVLQRAIQYLDSQFAV